MLLDERHPAGVGGESRALLLLLPLFLSLRQTEAHIQIPADYTYNQLKQAPVFRTQPVSHTAFYVEDLNLSCEASGDPPPSFRWLKDGSQFGDELFGSGTLTPDPMDLTKDLRFYQGIYRCYAGNELGTAVSNLVHIITEPVPSLTNEKPSMLRFEEGDGAVLHCNPPKSSTSPKIHWMDIQFHHIPLDERVTTSLGGNLHFANVLQKDSREDYTCHAHYIKAKVILPKEPIIISVSPSNSVLKIRRPRLQVPGGERSSYTVLKGQTLTLECIPEGLPTPEVQWERLDPHRSADRAQELNSNRWLQIKNVLESDDGEYVCTATNSQGSVKHHYTVTVEAAPSWTKRPEDHLYAPGETVRLDCQAAGIPAPNISWSINGVPISGTDSEPRRRVSSGTLILSKVQLGDTAIYQCEASNKHGNILINTRVHVIELPAQILTEDGLIYRTTVGRTVLLDCRTFGLPLPKVDWELLDSSPALSDVRMSQMTDGSLQISNVSKEDTSVYTCSLRNGNGSISAQLEVLNRTQIVSAPQNLNVIRGRDATLHCKYTMDSSLKHPTIQWKKDGHKITASTSNNKYYERASSLVVAGVEMEDTGLYSCEVSTELDSDSASGSITVQDKPAPPHSLELSEKKGRSVTVSWTPGAEHNSPVLEYIVEVEEQESPGEGRWMQYERVPQDSRHVEVHLHLFSTYLFRIRAVNAVGTSEPSVPSEAYSTPAAKPDINPGNVTTVSTDPKSMIITWKEMERRLFNGPDFKYRVYWRQTSDRGSRWKESTLLNPPLVVNDTEAFVTFEIKVQAVNELGAGPEPVAVIGYSGEDLPLEAPSAVSVKDFSKTSITVKWSPVNPKSVRGHLLGYKIYLTRIGPRTQSQRAGEVDRVIKVSPEKLEEVVGDLRFYSDYSLTVTAFNSRGEGPHSDEKLFSTPEGAPGPVSFLNFESPSETEITLRWGAPPEPNGEIRGYLLQYQEILLGEVESIKLPLGTEFTLKDLNPQSHYLFDLRAWNSAAEGESVKGKTTTLLDGEPPSELNTTAGETAVNISWVPGARHRNFAFSFRYLKKSAHGDWKETEMINSTQGFYRLQGLDPGSRYLLEIRNTSYLWEFMTSGPELGELASSFATQVWFITVVSSMVVLLLVLFILCFIKKSKGGKYSVKDKEDGQGDAAGRTLKDDAFGEYRSLESDNEKCSISQPSICESKRSSNDSLADYGDSVDIQFNEDGSFIGQYSGRRDPQTHQSSGATSPINASMPPPSISFPTSVTGILGPN